MDGGLVVAGDCRSDSPGHSAKYGSYSLIEERVNKVVDVQLVQCIIMLGPATLWFLHASFTTTNILHLHCYVMLQSSEVPNSSWCELEGLKCSISLLRRQDLHLSTLITDRHCQVAKWVREELCPEGTQHYFDVWHVGKSLGKALDTASKDRQCDQLQLWRPAIVNHLYWTAASTPDGNPAVMEAKWRSLVNHIQDIHDHDTPAFSSCAHPPLEGDQRDKEWLEPGSMGAKNWKAKVTKTSLLKDVRQLSPQHQTFSLEAFHSLILHFAPKHTGFSYLGMYSRSASLHYNFNANRETARRSDGTEKFCVRYPRFREGAYGVRPIKEKASYGYATSLIEALRESYTQSPKALQEVSANLSACAPAPITKSFEQIPKEEAISLYLAQQSRYYKSN
ncbi:unnamed protein product [Leuciscus chuanchicus]